MKKLALTLLLTLSLTTASADNFIHQLKQAVGSSPEVNINLGSWLIKTMANLSDDEDAQEAKALMQGLDKIKVTVFDLENSANKTAIQSIVSSKINNLSNQGYETLVKVKDEEEQVYIVAKVSGKILQDAMIIALDDEDELVVISLVGNVDLEQLALISDEFDVDLDDVLDI